MGSKGTDHPKNGPEDKPPGFVKFSKYAAVGLEFPSTVLGGLILGYFLDRYLGTSPWFTVALTLLALVGSFVRLVQMLRRLSEGKK